ncbi:xanthine dehydrogenase family protein subunit M [Baekduia soli]|uniref:Xanthine dehydrogenase family protein subunit M n=1 Tax=Baekduia soli TaxID=496014 RepID=A0A5B8U9X9_9ACTN|nr:xanthine dehydrogenase family protein subunit M [Baekduia soli]QEC49774.1 xanthine dehydrogenase family protein subunit M [Baekduia soli]
MIPAEFDYVAPTTIEEAIAALGGDEDAKLLAGGHSLVPLMKLRLAAPTRLVDLRRIEGLRGISRDGDRWRIGSMTRHADLQVRDDLGLIASAAALIADQQVRNRGTFGGSVAHGDPASDLPTVLLTLDGTVSVTGPGGVREIAAGDVFQDYLTTALAPDEVMTALHVPALDDWGHGYQKFTRRSEDWAIVGVCAVVRKAADGTCADVRVGLTNMGSTPLRATAVEAALRGQPLTGEAIAAAAAHADEGTEPAADLNATADYKRHLARVLTGRALREAVAA